MNKKGFTLIELLAVIVILAIIALIATPIVLSIINQSKESAQLRSAEMYLDAVEQSIAIEKLTDTTFNPNRCIIENGNLNCDEYDKNPIEVKVNGEKPESGLITFEKGKIKDVNLLYGNKAIVKDASGSLVYEGSPGEKIAISPKKETYTIGELVTIGEEKFYVIADAAEKVTLLAEKCLDTNTMKQSDNYTSLAFASEKYWNDDVDLNTLEVPEGVTTPALTAAREYGTSIGGTGRLLSLEESEWSDISLDNRVLYPEPENHASIDYWCGFAVDGGGCVVFARSTYEYEEDEWVHYMPSDETWEQDQLKGVRPVVEISKDKIS